jgi:hypothetical protein
LVPQDRLSTRAALADYDCAVRRSALGDDGAAAIADRRTIAIVAAFATLVPATLTTTFPATLTIAIRFTDPYAYASRAFYGDALSGYARSGNGHRQRSGGGNDEQ